MSPSNSVRRDDSSHWRIFILPYLLTLTESGSMLIPKVEDARAVPECMTDPSEALYMVVRLALARSRLSSRSLIGVGR